MKASLLFAAIFLTTVFCAYAQTPSPSPTPDVEGQTISTTPDQNLPVRSTAQPGLPLGPLQNTYQRPAAKKRFIGYVNGMFGPIALGKNAATAGISTWRNSPEEWGDKWEGFGRRFASNVGKSIIKGTVSYGLEEAFKLDSKYYRSKKKDAGSRVRNALLSAVTARDKNGKRVFGFPRIVGGYAASITAAEMWYPSRFDWKDGVKNGTVSLGFTAAFNLVKEFLLKK